MAQIFRFQKTSERSLIIGPTGSGKSVLGMFLLLHADFTVKPWIIVDYKEDKQFDDLPITDYIQKPDQKIKTPGLYVYRPELDNDEEIESFFKMIHKREKAGLFFDELQTVPFSTPLKAILQQGRSKKISVIACSQRPVGFNRAFISEAQILISFPLSDERDSKTLSGAIPESLLEKLPDLPDYHSVFYDATKRKGTILAPCPKTSVLLDHFKIKHNSQYRFR